MTANQYMRIINYVDKMEARKVPTLIKVMSFEEIMDKLRGRV